MPFTEEPFTHRRARPAALAAMEVGAWSHMVEHEHEHEHEHERRALARLAAQAHATQRADPAYRSGAAAWTEVHRGAPRASPPVRAATAPAHKRLADAGVATNQRSTSTS